MRPLNKLIHLCNTIQRAQVCLCAHRLKQILLSCATSCYFIRWTKSGIEYYQTAWCINCLWHLISMLHQITWYNSGTEKSYWDTVITLEPWKVILIKYDLNFLFPLLRMGYFFHLKAVLSMYKYTYIFITLFNMINWTIYFWAVLITGNVVCLCKIDYKSEKNFICACNLRMTV